MHRPKAAVGNGTDMGMKPAASLATLLAMAAPAAAAPVAATVAAARSTQIQIRPALVPTDAQARQAVIGTLAQMVQPGAESVLGGLAERLPGRAGAAIDPLALPLGLARITTGNRRLSAGAGIGTHGLRSTLAFKSPCASLLPTEISTRVRLGAILSTRAQAEWQSCPGAAGWSWGLGSSIAAGPATISPGAAATASLSRRFDVGRLRTRLALRPNGDKAAELSLQLRRFLPLQFGVSSGETAGRRTHTLSARLGLRF